MLRHQHFVLRLTRLAMLIQSADNDTRGIETSEGQRYVCRKNGCTGKPVRRTASNWNRPPPCVKCSETMVLEGGGTAS